MVQQQPFYGIHCIHDITPSIYDIKSIIWYHTRYPCNITATASMTSQPLCLGHDVHYMCHLTHCEYDNTATMCDITPTVSDTNPLYIGHHTHSVDDITPTLYMTSVWCMHDTTCTIHDITFNLDNMKTQYLWHHTHSIWHHIHCICVITPTVSISHPLYVWPHTHYCMTSYAHYDITPTLYDTKRL